MGAELLSRQRARELFTAQVSDAGTGRETERKRAGDGRGAGCAAIETGMGKILVFRLIYGVYLSIRYLRRLLILEPCKARHRLQKSVNTEQSVVDVL